jgi:hypothetical protein
MSTYQYYDWQPIGKITLPSLPMVGECGVIVYRDFSIPVYEYSTIYRILCDLLAILFRIWGYFALTV